MKFQHLMLAAGIAVFTGCDTPSNVTSTQNDYATTNASTAVNVPATVQTQFSTRYPSASNAEWSMYNATTIPIQWDLTDWPTLTTNDYVVRYNMDNNQYYAWYDTQGNWVGSTYQVNDFTKLPSGIQTMLSAQYPGYTINEVHREDWKDKMGYEIEMKKDNSKVKLLVDEQGNILKQKTKTQ